MIEKDRIYNIDCLDGLKEMIKQGMQVDCIITDPPYLINYRGIRADFRNPILNDSNPQLIIDVMPLLYRVLKEDSAMYMFCSPDTLDFFLSEVKKYFIVKNVIIWDKQNAATGDVFAQYRKSYECIIYANKGRALFQPNMPRYDSIWRFGRVSSKEQIHQNQKPLNLIYRMIHQHTQRGGGNIGRFFGKWHNSNSSLQNRTTLYLL